MKKIEYNDYFNRVYGCMIGKCVSGTAGAPYEGMKQRLNLHFTAEMADTTLPNDDLDLQILWLEVLEKKGICVTSDDLAQTFLYNCPYSPGEYAVFKKNYRRHIHPPYSGNYNNPYYLEGMGCPIRSEIWACIAPGNPKLASELARMDGVMDHGDNSVWGECFLAALEAQAFFEKDIPTLIEKSLCYIPQDSRMYALIDDARRWCMESEDYSSFHGKMMRKYGHPDCTNVFQNMGIIIYALLRGKNDLLESTEIAVNAGYDTDCTGATVGAIIGLILGAEAVIDVKNHTSENQKGVLRIQAETLAADTRSVELDLKAKETLEIPVVFTVQENCRMIMDHNPVEIEFCGDDTSAKFCCGFAGAVPWALYGPYWENVFPVEMPAHGHSYMEQFPGNTKEERIDRIRDYHLSAAIDLKKEYLDLKKLSQGIKTDEKDVVYTYEDRIKVSDLIDFQGPCILYLSRSFYSPVERDCRLYIGYSDAFSLWLNGEKMAERTNTTWWTGENVHLNHVHLKKGMNHMAVRIARRSLESCYSFSFLENEEAALGILSFPEHITDMGYCCVQD